MDMKGITAWIEAHPGESVVIGLGGTLALLWLFGFFSSSSQSNSGASNLAAAYYAAEAQQAVVGGQIQIATIGAAASTAQNAANANAAVAINASQTGAATTINGQNASSATTIATTTAWDKLLGTYSNDAAALATTQSNNATAIAVNQSNNDAWTLNDLLGSGGVFAQELAKFGSAGFSLPGGGWAGLWSGANLSPSALQSMGYTNQQALNIASGKSP